VILVPIAKKQEIRWAWLLLPPPNSHRKMIKIISSMTELGAGKRGASLGMEAIRIASFKKVPGFFEQYPVEPVDNVNHLLYSFSDNPFGKRIEGIVKMYRRLAAKVSDTLEDNDFPFVISGDHSNGGATIKGIKQAHPEQRLGVIWIDAHADLHSPYTSPSGNMHGMPLATAIAEDNLEMKQKDINAETAQFWNKLKGPNQRINPQDIIFIALRDTEAPEDHLIEKYGMRVYRVDEVRQRGIDAVVAAAMQQLTACDAVYISFDVDSMDTSVSIGTGTPVPGGLSEAEATAFMAAFAREEKVCCMELTEVNPLLDDKGNAMGEAAFRIVKNTVDELEKRMAKQPNTEISA
jgi:arginase